MANENTLFLKNLMEDMVWLFLDEVLKKWPEACSCAVCRHDVAALSLNELRPHYVVRREGEVLSRTSILEAQYRADVVAALTRAILKVMAKPRHGQG